VLESNNLPSAFQSKIFLKHDQIVQTSMPAKLQEAHRDNIIFVA
jgi:hypothetical protein